MSDSAVAESYVPTLTDEVENGAPTPPDVQGTLRAWGWTNPPADIVKAATRAKLLEHRSIEIIVRALKLESAETIRDLLADQPKHKSVLQWLAQNSSTVRERKNMVHALHLGVQYTDLPQAHFTVHPLIETNVDIKREAGKFSAILMYCQETVPILVFADVDDYRAFDQQTGPDRIGSPIRKAIPDLKYAIGPRNVVLRAIDELGSSNTSSAGESVKVIHSSSLKEDETYKLLDSMHSQALDEGSTDIHIRAQPNGDPVVAYRVFGEVERMAVRLTEAQYAKIASYLLKRSGAQVTAGKFVDPADGRYQYVDSAGNTVNVRCSFIPSQHILVQGDPAVSVRLRLQKMNDGPVDLGKIGLREDVVEIIDHQIRRKQGIILLVGPTGSGKSTTIAGALARHSNVFGISRAVISAEDPVERFLPDIDQFEIATHRRGKDGFAILCRNFMRHDPDVIFQGEIRDKETAEYAVQFGDTGHLVVSTLHAKTAASALQRLLNMLPPEKPLLRMAAIESTNLIIGQTLVKKLCPHCAGELAPLSDEEAGELRYASELKGFDIPLPAMARRKNPDGCSKCRHGISGVLPINDVLEMTDALRDKLMKSNDEIVPLARAATKIRFEQMAAKLIEDGLTPYSSMII